MNPILRLLLAIPLLASAASARAAEWDLTYRAQPPARFAALGAGANAYFAYQTGGAVMIDAIAPGGARAWSRRIDLDATVGDLEAGGGRACISIRPVPGSILFDPAIWCFDETDGDAEGRYLARVDAGRIVSVRANTLRFWGTVGSATGLFDQNGQTATRVAAAATNFALTDVASNGAGEVLLAGTSTAHGAQLTLVEADGGVRFGPVDVPGDLGMNVGRSVALLDDGTSVVLNKQTGGDGTRAIVVRRYNANGQPLWTRRLDSRYYKADLAVDASGMYLALANAESPSLLPPTRLTKLALADGSTLWQRDFGAPYTHAAPALAIDAASGSLLFLYVRGSELVLDRYTLAQGLPLGLTRKSCGGDACEWPNTRIDPRGALLAAASVGASGDAALFADDAPFMPPTGVERVDQSALEGAWFFPGTSGQGLLLDYISAQRTLFLTWFTYDVDGTAGPAGLRWYTLQGTAAPGATSVDLTIYRNAGGAFLSGTTSAQRVGIATLLFPACDLASLDYEFDPGFNNAARGTLSLSRLTPALAPCVEPRDEPVAPQIASAGFDARQSGAWYDPATSGQGFDFVVRPGDASDPGSIFGAWFTYDPAGAADDPFAQHWLTLQGSLAGASGGTVTLPLYRTTGGVFDAGSTVATQQVGTATVHFDACTSARVDYRFDANAGAFAGRSGSIALVGTAVCSP